MFKVLDLFSGIGVFSLELESEGEFETIAFCEIEEFPRKVLKKHWPNVPVANDVRKLTYNKQSQQLWYKTKVIYVGAIDVICGGFPCQDISTAGKGAGLNGKRSGLWFELARLINEVGPWRAIVENVPALRSRGLSTCLQNLSAFGYDAEWHCISASHVGAPHQRDRIWIISYPNGSRRKARHYGSRWQERPNTNRRSAGANLANTPSEQLSNSKPLKKQAGQQEPADRSIGNGNPANTNRTRTQIPIERELTAKPLLGSQGPEGRTPIECGPWAVEPRICRVVDGAPNRVHRIRACGNAVVRENVRKIKHAILATNHPERPAP